jgi:hypothetical protein
MGFHHPATPSLVGTSTGLKANWLDKDLLDKIALLVAKDPRNHANVVLKGPKITSLAPIDKLQLISR